MKFCARFNFNLADETRQLLENFLNLAPQGLTSREVPPYKGGGERIKQELKSFLGVDESPVKSKWVRFFMESGCYRLLDLKNSYQPDSSSVDRMVNISEILPELSAALAPYLDRDFQFDTYLSAFCRDLAPEDFQHLALRLGLTRNERDFSEQYRKLKDDIPNRFGSLHEFSSPAEIYDIFNGLHLVTVTACLLELGQTDRKRMKTLLEAFLKYKRKWEKTRLELNGKDLIELGVPEGKLIGQLLDRLLHAKLIGQTPDRLSEVQYIQNCLVELNLTSDAKSHPDQPLTEIPNAAPGDVYPVEVPTDV